MLPAVLSCLIPSEVPALLSYLLLDSFHVVIIKLHLITEPFGSGLDDRLLLPDKLIVELPLLLIGYVDLLLLP